MKLKRRSGVARAVPGDAARIAPTFTSSNISQDPARGLSENVELAACVPVASSENIKFEGQCGHLSGDGRLRVHRLACRRPALGRKAFPLHPRPFLHPKPWPQTRPGPPY